MTTTRRRITHRSLARGLHILELVATSEGGGGLANLARQAGLHRSTAHHLLQALVADGYLRQDAVTHRYHPGPRLRRVLGPAPTADYIARVAQPYLAEIAQRSGECAALAVVCEGLVRYVASRAPPGSGRSWPIRREPAPLQATTAGRAILAFQAPGELSSPTAGRAAGIAIDGDALAPGMRTLAAPVFDPYGRAAAALCVIGAKARLTRLRVAELGPPLRDLADALSRQLGWQPLPTGGRPAGAEGGRT